MKPDAPILVKLREMILQGRLAPGERVAEAAIAEALGLSRTPVRQALPVLAEEGLLSPHGARGYAVRAFTLREIVEAVEARGVATVPFRVLEADQVGEVFVAEK